MPHPTPTSARSSSARGRDLGVICCAECDVARKNRGMSSMRETAEQFFDACETGRGWDGCAPYCHPGATFAGQTAALAGIDTLEAYTEWMKNLLTPLPDGTAEVRSFAVD